MLVTGRPKGGQCSILWTGCRRSCRHRRGSLGSEYGASMGSIDIQGGNRRAVTESRAGAFEFWATSGDDSNSAPRGDRNSRTLAVTNVFGDPGHPRTWSGAPYNVAQALRRRGFDVVPLHAKLGRFRKLVSAGRHIMAGYGPVSSSEAIFRGLAARTKRARLVAQQVRRLGIDHVLHTGTLDLPVWDSGAATHDLFCDQTWALSLRYRPDAANYSTVACRHFEDLERESYSQMRHIFTFGRYVRKNLIEHYGVAPERVTAVGSGMGNIAPYIGPKDYGNGVLLFVAKHLFAAKGGVLLLEAFRIVRERRPDLTLVIVGSERQREIAAGEANVEFHAYVPWPDLEGLYRRACVLVQPMLNDPWGQVYLEALASRTPVIGLNRNGLPEITEFGRHGFLVDDADPEALAEAVLDAVSDPNRLAQMGESGQRHVVQSYSWDRVSRRIADRITMQ